MEERASDAERLSPPVAAASHSHVLDLPIELIECIASCLSPADLLPFRLTCCSLAAGAAKSFIETHFHDRCFMLFDQLSMSMLVAIASHPIFGKSLRCIRFSFLPLRSGHVNHFSRIRYDGRPQDYSERALRRIYTRAHQDLYQQQVRFPPKVEDYLVFSLLCLKSDNSIPAVIATSDEEVKPFNYRTLVKFCGYPECLYQNRGCRDGFETIYNAIALADYPVERLELGSLQFGVPLRFFQGPLYRSTLGSLMSLKLTASPEQVAE